MYKKETVSVVICTYNGAAFIEEQLNSILLQTYPIFEIIICDDKSTDNTVLILESFAANDSRIKLVKNKAQLGFEKNFEQAILLSTGNCITISDQDDIWLPKKTELLIECWPAKSPLVYCDSALFENKIPTTPKPNPLYRRFTGEQVSKLFLFNTVSGHAMLFRRSFIQKIMPFKQGLYYDWCMAVIAGCNGGVTYLPYTLVLQRVHANNVSIVKKQSAKEITKQKRQIAIDHLAYFITIENMAPSDVYLAQKLSEKLKKTEHFMDKTKLFLLLMHKRKTLFNSVKRIWALPSHVKLAYKLAFK